MKLKKILLITLMMALIFVIFENRVLATSEIVTAMGEANTPINETGKGVGKVINIVIGLLQVAGTGISLIVVTMLGIKYIMAAPAEKADVKKQIIPIIIGCVLLFGAVNLLSVVYNFSQNAIQ